MQQLKRMIEKGTNGGVPQSKKTKILLTESRTHKPLT